MAALGLGRAPPIDCASARHAEAKAFAESVVADAASRWIGAFARKGLTYAAPRTIYLCTPLGHPSRGSGYAPRVGLLVDLDDIKRLEEVLGADAGSMVALILAHEMGHHAQTLAATRESAGAPLSPLRKEAQADCFAGWTLRERATAQGGPSSAGDLGFRMSRTLQLMDALQSGGVALGRNAPPGTSHARVSERVEAVERGYASEDPWRC